MPELAAQPPPLPQHPSSERVPFTVVMADDDEDDRMFAGKAWDKVRTAHDLRFVRDGQELLEYLTRRGEYRDADDDRAPRPSLVLLDLNMPRMDGREALTAIKADAGLRSIPVVVMTTSADDEDIVRSYQLGVSGFISKPVGYDGLLDVIDAIDRYWMQAVKLPGRGGEADLAPQPLGNR